MPLQVFDYRRDIKNVVITPEIRARFLRFEVGAVATRHSHDLGAEVFLILQGAPSSRSTAKPRFWVRVSCALRVGTSCTRSGSWVTSRSSCTSR